MKLKEGDEILGVVATSLIENREGICPTDEEFALYIEKRLTKDKRKAIISHFVSCRECRERLTIPASPLGVVKESATIEKFLLSFWRPLVAASVAVVFFVFLGFSLNIYLKSRYITEDRERGANLVALKQIDLNSNLLTIIRDGDKEGLKNELIKGLPPGARVSRVVVEDINHLKKAKEGEKINLILYSNGLLKVRLKE
jgi:hypothetical protein